MTCVKKLTPYLLILSLAVFPLLLSSCGAGDKVQNGNAGYSFTDSTGASVTLEKKPERVAVLFSSFAEIWQLAGGTVQITVGEAVERGFADQTAVLVDPGSGHSTINVETLVEAEPDFVIGTADYAGQCEAVDFCRNAGIPAALFKVETFEDYLSVLSVFCDITDRSDRYDTYGTKVKNQVEAAKTRVADLKENADETPSILFLRAGSSDRSTKAKTPENNFVCVMLKELGCENIAEKHGLLVGELSLEVILEENPSHLFITTMGDEEAATEHIQNMLSKDGWRELDCVKNEAYFFLPRDTFHFKPNARWGDAYEYLISILYPEEN